MYLFYTYIYIYFIDISLSLSDISMYVCILTEKFINQAGFYYIKGDFMKIFGLIIKKEQKAGKIEEDFDFRRELKEAKLEHEKEVMSIKLRTIKKQQELDESILDYKLKEQQARIDEEFTNIPDGLEDVLEEHTDDVPEWLQPFIGPLLGKVLNNTAQSPATSPPLTTTEQTAGGLSLTDEELRAIKDTTSKSDLITLRNLPDAQVKSVIRGRYPKITDECLERAIIILKK